MVSEMGEEHSAAAKRAFFRDLGLPILFGAVVLLVSATLMLGANITALRGNLSQIEQSQQVLNRISQLEIERLALELSVRGYALTGDGQFIKDQQDGDARRAEALAGLERLTASDPQRAEQYRPVIADIRRHAAIFDKLSQPGADRAARVTRVILDPKVRAFKYGLRNDLATLRTAELNDIGARQRAIAGQLVRAFFLAVGIIAAAFVLGGIGMWAVQIKGAPHP